MKVLVDNLKQIKEILMIYVMTNKSVFYLFVLSMFFIIIKKKNKLFVLYIIISLVVLIEPLLLYVIKNVYKSSYSATNLYYLRLFYGIPFNIVISYALIDLISKRRTKAKMIFLIIILLFIKLIGSTPITKDGIIDLENSGRIPSYNYFIKKTFDNDKTFKRVLVPNHTLTSIKQTNPEILLVKTGRASEPAIDQVIEEDKANIDILAAYLDNNYIEYFSIKDSETNSKQLNKDYLFLGSDGNYALYQNNHIDGTEYDEFGYIKQIKTNRYEGISTIAIERNENNQIIEEKLLDNNRNNASYMNYSYIIREYSEHGSLLSISYLDSNKNPINNTSGYQKVIFNSNGRSYIDASGNEVSIANGLEYVAQTNVVTPQTTEVIYYNLDQKPYSFIDGVNKIVYTYDQDKRLIKTEFFDEKGNETQKNGEYTTIEAIYDDNGQKTNIYKNNDAEIKRAYEFEVPSYLIEVFDFVDTKQIDRTFEIEIK